MSNFAIRECYLCGTMVPSEIHDYERLHRYKCSNCGEYQITSQAKVLLNQDKEKLKEIVMKGQASSDDDSILTITSDAIKPELR